MTLAHDFCKEQGPLPSVGIAAEYSGSTPKSSGLHCDDCFIIIKTPPKRTLLDLLLAGAVYEDGYMSCPNQSPTKKDRKDGDDDDDDAYDEIPSAKELWEDFLHSLTLHGFRFMFEEGPKIRKIFWLVLLLLAVGMLFFQSRKSIQKYFDRPITTSVQVEFLQEIMFPAVTICNFNLFPYYLINGTIGEKVSSVFCL